MSDQARHLPGCPIEDTSARRGIYEVIRCMSNDLFVEGASGMYE
jgi:hypothetical protein